LEPIVPVLIPALETPVPTHLFAEPTLAVRPWVDDIVDTLGFDPRSSYVERFWLGILGPSTTWLLRRVAAGFDAHPEGYDLPLAETAREIGLGDKGGRNSPFVRALVRCCQFELARPPADGGLEVRRKLAPLTRRQVARLPEGLRLGHEEWQQAQLGGPPIEEVRLRARRLALSLVELGEDTESVERQLQQWRFHPALAHQATAWACDRHHIAAPPPAPAAS
jgi:hypothetical protein